MPNTYRIQPEDISPCRCYWCFADIEFNKQLALYNELPYHRKCLKEIIKDRRRYDLINEMLDYFKLYQSETYIQGMLEEIPHQIKNYYLVQIGTYIEIYVMTETKLQLIRHHFDSVRDDLSIELSMEQFKTFNQLVQ